MILINMMMAIINLAFEEVKTKSYANKFELMNYVTRTAKEMIGIRIADPINPKYKSKATKSILKKKQTPQDKTEKVSAEFSEKTNSLLKYVEDTYLNGKMDEETKQYIAKMKQAENFKPNNKKKAEYGFDALFKDN
jgi:hypothetical protein